MLKKHREAAQYLILELLAIFLTAALLLVLKKEFFKNLFNLKKKIFSKPLIIFTDVLLLF